MKITNIIKCTKPIILMAGLSFLSIVALAGEEAREFTPHSSVANPQEAGFSARTHTKILIPPGGYVKLNNDIRANPNLASGAPPYLYANETPASLACNYKITASVGGCSPANYAALANPTGGAKAIAVVDAYHYTNAAKDLATFSTKFGLPAASLQVVYATGIKPASDPLGWEIESALDLQWAHAMAPNAKLYLVEAKSNSIADLILAVDKATALVVAAGGGEVSMSWGSAEFSTESTYDSHFVTSPNVVYFASSGDASGTSWPCVSANVICVGGTTIRRNPSSGNVVDEVAWTDGGGGVSTFISKPSYQSALTSIGNRGVPDVSLAADPRTGAWVYYTASNSSFVGWMIVGGTSWSAPTFAGMVNQAGSFLASSNAELSRLYANANYYRDVATGWCGYYGGTNAGAGWDSCTGLGINSNAVLGKQLLAGTFSMR